jgi:hypothetical protein
MKKILGVLTTLTFVCSAQAVFATGINLTSALFNSSAAGVVGAGSTGFPVTPGLSGNLDGTTGLGTLTFTDTKVGAGFFDVFVDLALSTPFFNEFGKTGGGSPAVNESWQIDVPDYWCNTVACQALGLPVGSPDPNDPGANVIANTLAHSLSNHNGVPGNGGLGTFSNYLNTCGAEPSGVTPQNIQCNNDVALAIGFNYLIPSGYRELITVTVSQAAPASGFYVEQLHPSDPDNPSGTSPVFLYGSATLQPLATPVPEPATAILLSTGLIAAGSRFRRRSEAKNAT